MSRKLLRVTLTTQHGKVGIGSLINDNGEKEMYRSFNAQNKVAGTSCGKPREAKLIEPRGATTQGYSGAPSYTTLNNFKTALHGVDYDE